MKVRVAEPAEAQIEARRSWWRTHRTERDLFDEELDAALRFLRDNGAMLPVVRKRRGRPIRRVLMQRTGCHLYFEVLGNELVVIAAWGAARGRLPRLT